MKWKTERRNERRGCLEACEAVVASHHLFVYVEATRPLEECRFGKGSYYCLLFLSLHFSNRLHCRRGSREERKIGGKKESDREEEEAERQRRGWRGDQVRGCVVDVFMYSMFTPADNVYILSCWSCVGVFFGLPVRAKCLQVSVCACWMWECVCISVKPGLSPWHCCENAAFVVKTVVFDDVEVHHGNAVIISSATTSVLSKPWRGLLLSGSAARLLLNCSSVTVRAWCTGINEELILNRQSQDGGVTFFYPATTKKKHVRTNLSFKPKCTAVLLTQYTVS